MRLTPMGVFRYKWPFFIMIPESRVISRNQPQPESQFIILDSE